MKRWSGWIALGLIFSLLLGCSNASNYIKETYPLVDVQGNGKNNAKVYSAADKDVPAVAEEITKQETPEEVSKRSTEKMFLIYNGKIINIQKDPANDSNSLVEIDSIEYAKHNYASDFLKSYLTASILQSVLGGSWIKDDGKSQYGGYSTQPKPDSKKPSTSERSGSFSSKSKAPSSSSALSRKNDGSTPSFKQPSTSKRSGSFTKKKY
jgi:hypothetical protein